jgi:hypothetical protein
MGGPKRHIQPERYAKCQPKLIVKSYIDKYKTIEYTKKGRGEILLEKNCKINFNSNIKKWDNKYFRIIKIWYIVFTISCLIGQYLYLKNIHDNDTILITMPFFHFPFTFLFWICRAYLNRPHGDKEYIFNYYPNIYKELYLRKNEQYKFYQNRRIKNMFFYNDFVNGFLTSDDDEILNDILIRSKEQLILLIFPFIFIIITVVITIINIILKHGI